jgi:hypothetical protein
MLRSTTTTILQTVPILRPPLEARRPSSTPFCSQSLLCIPVLYSGIACGASVFFLNQQPNVCAVWTGAAYAWTAVVDCAALSKVIAKWTLFILYSTLTCKMESNRGKQHDVPVLPAGLTRWRQKANSRLQQASTFVKRYMDITSALTYMI